MTTISLPCKILSTITTLGLIKTVRLILMKMTFRSGKQTAPAACPSNSRATFRPTADHSRPAIPWRRILYTKVLRPC